MEYIVKYNGDIGQLADQMGIGYEILNTSYAIMSIDPEQVSALQAHPQIEYLEPESKLALLSSPTMIASCIAQVQNDSTYRLSGKGVLIAILDSGIDYQHPDFINEDGTTRILSLWDQNLLGIPPSGFRIGAEYSQEAINLALAAPIEERNAILPHIDYNGHGTAVAGVAAGNGRASVEDINGAAPESTLLIVCLQTNSTQYNTSNTNLMRGVKYAIDKAIAANMPLVINISYGTNYGPHDGHSLFEQYLDSMSDLWETAIVVPTGNEGITGKHYYGHTSTGALLNIQFSSQAGLSELPITFSKPFVDDLQFSISDSSGHASNTINIRQPLQQVVVGNTNVTIEISQPAPYISDQVITMLFRGRNNTPIPQNIWTIQIRGLDIVVGTVDLWLPGSEISGGGSAFLNPNLDTTLTVPSTADKVITVGGYDSLTDTFYDNSGRGYTRTNEIKPDLTAPAKNVMASSPGGGYAVYSGTSFAAPHVSGGCALMMEWGIVRGNDPFLFGQRLKAFLRMGATRLKNTDYPSPLWGFGRLCIENSLNFAVLYNIGHPLTPLYGPPLPDTVPALSSAVTLPEEETAIPDQAVPPAPIDSPVTAQEEDSAVPTKEPSPQFSGRLSGEGDVQSVSFQVMQKDTDHILHLLTSAPDRVSVSLTAPFGKPEAVAPFTDNSKQSYDFSLGLSKVTVISECPHGKSGEQIFTIRISNPMPGEWILDIYGDLIFDGRFSGEILAMDA